MPVRSSRFAILLLAAPSSASLALPPGAAAQRAIDVRAGPLDSAIASLAQQAGVDIGSAEPDLGRVRTRGVRGRLTAAAALDRLLAGTPFASRPLPFDGFRIVRRRTASMWPRTRPVIPQQSVEQGPAEDVVVIASKRDTTQLRFPGALTVIYPGGELAFGDDAASGLDKAIAATPILQGTALGAGRNKVFIRGVADSSFTGPTQSTANIYFGDVPVAYNGPDPALNLYDMDRVEVIEGPQGTLYGAGAIGGIVRLVPRPVDLTRTAANVSGGVSVTRSGEPGGDIAAMVNIPIVSGVAGIRAVNYRVREGGYIDDVRRHLVNVNGITTSGGRFEVRVAPASGWTIESGIVAQRVTAQDLQYAERGQPPLSRASLLVQPFAQDYLLGRVVVDKRWGDGLHLISATGIVRRDAKSRFDATRPSRPNLALAYDTDERSRLFAHEARLSRTRADGTGWLIGTALIKARDAYARAYGAPDRLRDIVGVSNRTLDVAVFAEAGLAVSKALVISAGGRATHQRSDGEPIARLNIAGAIHGRSVTRFDPAAGLSWLVAPDVAAYARYQSGFRTGGITVAPGIGRVADLMPDTIRVTEVGLRKTRVGALGIAGAVGLSLTDWRHIQADLVDRSGFPFTTNLGNSRISGAEGNASWIPARGLRLDIAMFYNKTRITDPSPTIRIPAGKRLPNTPPFAMSASVAYRWSTGSMGTASIDGGWRYVGQSSVGTQAPLDVTQGDYGSVNIGGSWSTGRVRLTATADNLLNVSGDRFAGGNPFALASREEYTPLKPRTVRLGGTIAW